MNTTFRLPGALLLAAALAVGSGCAATADRQSTGQLADSAVLTTKVKTALAKDSLASLLDIEVESFRDVVLLSGFVDTEAERLHAIDVANNVTGVAKVESGLVIKPGS